MKLNEICRDIIKAIEKNKVVLFTIALFLLNFILKGIFLVSNDIANDEPFSIYHAQMKISEFIPILKDGNNPPLYELILHFWIKLFGIGVLSVRLPSFIFSCLTAIVIFRTGKSFYSFSTGVVASLIFTFATIHTTYAHVARVYPLFVLLASLSFFLLMKYIYEDKKKYLLLLCLTNILLIYAHYFGFFILLNQLLSFFFFKRVRQNYKLVSIAAVVVLLPFVPMISSFAMQLYYSVDRGTWIEPPLMSYYYEFLNIFVNHKFISYIFLAILFLVILFNFIKNKRLKLLIDKDKKAPVFFVFLWFFIPYNIMFLVSFKVPMFINSYLLFTSIFYYLAMASFLCLSDISKILKMALIIVLLSGLIFYYDNESYTFRDIGKAISYVKENKTDSTLVFVCPDYDYIGFTYHYNKAFFSNYYQTLSLLEKDNVFLVSNKAEAMKVLLEHKCKQVIYYQSVSEYVDPRNEIFSFFEQLFKTQEQRKFICIYTVTVFRNMKEEEILKVHETLNK